MYNIIKHATKKYCFNIENYYKTIKSDTILENKKQFNLLCKDGCRNYNTKYSCPPYSPNFTNLRIKYMFAHVFFFRVNLKNYPQIYNTIRMVNTVAKSKQRYAINKISNNLLNDNIPHQILENGSCRLCKKCAINFKENCRHPKIMRYSLESTGVDVDALCFMCFGLPLQWYSNKNFPKYQGVLSAILCNIKRSIIN